MSNILCGNKKIYKIYYVSHLTGGPFSAIDRGELDVLVLSFLWEIKDIKQHPRSPNDFENIYVFFI